MKKKKKKKKKKILKPKKKKGKKKIFKKGLNWKFFYPPPPLPNKTKESYSGKWVETDSKYSKLFSGFTWKCKWCNSWGLTCKTPATTHHYSSAHLFPYKKYRSNKEILQFPACVSSWPCNNPAAKCDELLPAAA